MSTGVTGPGWVSSRSSGPAPAFLYCTKLRFCYTLTGMTMTTAPAPTTDGINVGEDVSVDTWEDGTITLTVGGQDIEMTREQARDALAALGYAVAVTR